MIRATTIFGLLLALLGGFGCGRNTDITRRDDKVDAWVAQERAEENERKRAREATPEPTPAQLPTATPDERTPVPEKAPPPRSSTQRPGAPVGERGSASGEGGITALGTCFAIDDHGTVITAHHVIADSRTIYVKFAKEEPLKAEVLAASASSDAAVLKVERQTEDFLPLAAPHQARVGLPVFTIGFPVLQLLGAEPRYTDGTISALSGVSGEASRMQISVPLQPGNSGGPLVDDRGEALGIAVATASNEAFYAKTGTLPQNVNFATKGENVRALLPKAPARRPATDNRRAAIDRATASICIVAASQ